MAKILIILALCISCGQFKGKDGKDGAAGATGEQGEAGSQGEKGDAGVSGKDGSDGAVGATGAKGSDGSNGKDLTPAKELSERFHNTWDLPNGGNIELIGMPDGRVYPYGGQYIRTINFDKGGALHPNLTATPQMISNNRIKHEYNMNYSSTTNDVEVDDSTSNITGSRRTITIFSLTDDDKLKIRIQIFDSANLNVVVDRTLTSE